MAKVIPLRRRQRKARAVQRLGPRKRGEWSSIDTEMLGAVERNLRMLKPLDESRDALYQRPYQLVEAAALDLANCAHLDCSHPHAMAFIGVGLDVLRSAYQWDIARRLRVKAIKTKRPATFVARARACEREALRQMRRTLRAVE